MSVDIRNSGKHAGKEIVQLYVAAPDSKVKNKPTKELKAFAKTQELKPGDTTTLTLTIAASDLASFDEAISAWVVDPGTYEFLIGSSSRDIRHKLNAEVKGYKSETQSLFAPQTAINTLKR